MIHEVVVAGIIVQAGKILIAQRPKGVHCGGFWEFPGGKIQSSEALENALKRELYEELGIEAVPLKLVSHKKHEYPEKTVELYFYLCEIVAGTPQPLSSQKLRWLSPEELKDYPFPPANVDVVTQIRTAAASGTNLCHPELFCHPERSEGSVC